LGHQASCLSAVVEDESPAVAKRDLFGLPGGALVEAFRLCAGGVPFLVEPVEVRVVIRDPFLDGLPGWLDLLDGIDVEGRRWLGGELPLIGNSGSRRATDRCTVIGTFFRKLMLKSGEMPVGRK
ncbi:hypothetical protein N9958_00270, partial [bacterium]|nr:hypothetical protein [bacterium]